MSLGTWLGLGAGSLVLLATSVSHAQCTMDNDCKGDRVCEQGQCVAPQQALPPAPAAPAGAAPAAAGPVAAAPVAAAPAPAPPPVDAAPPPPKMVRHSTGMMAGGIVMVSLSPVALLVAMGASISQSVCKVDNNYYDSNTGTTTYGRDCNNDGLIYGSLLTAAALVGVGIPLIVIGAKKEPEGTAIIAPWATPTAAGLGLRVNL